MRAYIELGSTPAEEDCAQVGWENYDTLSMIETKVYKEQLKRTFKLIGGMSFSIKSFPHDFGSYKEVVVNYDDANEQEVDLAFEIENNQPGKWDKQSIDLLYQTKYLGDFMEAKNKKRKNPQKKEQQMKKKNNTIVQDHKQNFETLSQAFADGAVALMECVVKATGEKVATICAVVFDGKEYTFTPFAIFLNGNPFELLEPPQEMNEEKSE